MILGEGFCTNPDNEFSDTMVEECAANIAIFMPAALKAIGDRLIMYNNEICNNWYDNICHK